MSDYSSVIDKIKSTVNLASLIGEKVKLQSKSGYTVGLCPFHNEKTPSFVVYPNSYFCFGCKKSGDAISFIQETQGISFIEAVKYLASKYNIELPEMSYSKKYMEQKDLAKRLFLAIQNAQVFFVNKLFSSEGNKARDYLHSRSFTDQDIRRLGFGYAPYGSQCFNKLKQDRFSNKEIMEASLGNEKNGKCYDFFQDRITIPIYDSYSRLVAFSGRAIDKEVLPKYKNSRENILFSKSDILFGFYKAKDQIRQGAKAILVEGNIDVFRLWLFGFSGAIASMGTAINEGHLKQIAYFTKELYLILDGDFAGKKATMSTLNLALKVPTLKIKVATLPQGEDPDSFLLTKGAEAFEDLMNNHATDLIDYVIQEELKSADSLEIPYKVSSSIVPWLVDLQDPIQRSFLITKVSEITGIDANEIKKQVKSKILEKVETNNSNSLSSLKRKISDINSSNISTIKNTNTNIHDDTIYEIPLSSLDKELLSHLLLYDGSSSKKIIEEVKNYLKYIKIDDIFLTFIKEILASLEKGEFPWKESLYQKWSSFIYEKVIDFTQELKKNEQAFEVKNREESILKILKQYKKLYLQESISNLKQQLSLETDNIEILKSISTMNNELKFL